MASDAKQNGGNPHRLNLDTDGYTDDPTHSDDQYPPCHDHFFDGSQLIRKRWTAHLIILGIEFNRTRVLSLCPIPHH